MANGTDDQGRRARELLARLSAPSGDVPSSALGRLRRTAAAAVRAGGSHALARLRGRRDLDLELVERLVLAMGELKGVAMKMGQILSYMDTTMPPEARELLALLQVRSQPIAFPSIEATLREDFGARADALLAGLVREPVATASIGQVHRARLPGGEDVAVKVRHPGVEAAIGADFRSAHVGKALARWLAPGSNIDELLAEAEARFLEECDYTQECRRQRRFAALHAGHPALIIPAVHPAWCSARVLTTSWQTGVGLDTFTARATQPERDAAGRALYEFYLGSLYRHGLFNADPHPGNLVFSAGGRVAVLDHGCVREFDAATVAAVAELSSALRADDAERVRASLAALGVRSADGPGFAVTLRMLRGFFEPVLAAGVRSMKADVSLEMRELFRTKKAMLQLQLPGKLLFLFRIRFGLHAVLARVGARLDWQALEAELSGRS